MFEPSRALFSTVTNMSKSKFLEIFPLKSSSKTRLHTKMPPGKLKRSIAEIISTVRLLESRNLSDLQNIIEFVKFKQLNLNQESPEEATDVDVIKTSIKYALACGAIFKHPSGLYKVSDQCPKRFAKRKPRKKRRSKASNKE